MVAVTFFNAILPLELPKKRYKKIYIGGRMHTAKLFKNGRSQAVRLPKDFRLEGKEVAISHMGDAIVLQPIRHSWLEVYQVMKKIPDFMNEREDLPPEDRDS